jgi:putative ABC transport system permease protein
MHKWLQLFSYNRGLSPLPFVLLALVVLGITMLTIIFHTARTAVANPAENLRSE